ncbi:MAG: intracellular sulfur oxidation DsrE/DsrF family protein [Sediminicola sp.]|jgi:intracellular sulfur oxidation DsrE/DsrF family protein
MNKLAHLVCFLIISTTISAQEWTTPIIKGYGKIKYFENVAQQPDSTLNYYMVFDVKDEREMDGVNIGLWKIARIINMLGSANISSDKIRIAAAMHGGATFSALNEEKYSEKYGKANPNAELLQLLNDYGVELYVCAQATAARGIEAKDLNSNTKLALSAMTVIANYQLKGYALMP